MSEIELLLQGTAAATGLYWAYNFDKGMKQAQEEVLNREYDSAWEIGYMSKTGDLDTDESFIKRMLDSPRSIGHQAGLTNISHALLDTPAEDVYNTGFDDVVDSLDESDLYTLSHRAAEGYDF